MSQTVSLRAEHANEIRRLWPAILACFATAVLGWGFGFTGTSVYLAELHRLRQWPTATIASAITAYYLLGALCLPHVHDMMRRLGPARMLSTSAGLLTLGSTVFSRSTHIWELYGAAVLMAAGWAGCTSAAISSTLALYFQHQRGLAITLALNGASTAGFTIAPLLVELSQHVGVGNAVPLVGACMLAIVIPLNVLGLPAPTGEAAAAASTATTAANGVLRTWRFWSVALPFALALAAQVGLIVHLVSFLLPHLGASNAATGLALTSLAAVGGRLVLAGIIDRLHQRRAAAASFATQAVGVALMLALRHRPEALYAGCVLFGLSVGNVITFPALIIQREFSAAAFGAVIGLASSVSQFTFALAPALLGLIRDATGGYAAVLAACILCQLAAAIVVLVRR
jgi:predicted MFS family arabinose efflux permease